MLTNKRVLITNDDGFNAPGIKALVEVIYEYTSNIIVIAPATQMSAISHARIFTHGFTFKKEDNIYKDVNTYSLDGTPADCVRFAKDALKEEFDYIISGINNGYNLGDDILYSGTCGAAFEAVLAGYKALCFSSKEHLEKEASIYIKDAIEYIFNNEYLLNKKLLNINIPLNFIGIKVTHQGYNEFKTTFNKVDNLYYPTGYPLGPLIKQSDDADIIAVTNGYISITPLTIDRTDYSK